MEEAQQQSTISNNTLSNLGFQMAGALQIRLNTSPILAQIEQYLKGEYIMLLVDQKTQRPIEKLVSTGEPLANRLGIQRIMSYLQGIFNPQVVQGNYSEEMYNHYLWKHRRALAKDIVLNITRYGINPDDVNGLMDRIFSMIEPFLSRMLENKERESYAQTIKSVESNTNALRTGRGFNPMGFMGGG